MTFPEFFLAAFGITSSVVGLMYFMAAVADNFDRNKNNKGESR